MKNRAILGKVNVIFKGRLWSFNNKRRLIDVPGNRFNSNKNYKSVISCFLFDISHDVQSVKEEQLLHCILLSQSIATCCKVARTDGSFFKINVYLFLPVIIYSIPGA